jgi:hypothetical protein
MMHRRILASGFVVLRLATEALATVGAGSSRIPFTDMLVELYNVTNNVYVPLAAILILLFCVINLFTGAFRIGKGLTILLGCVGILALGISWVSQAVGGTVNIALIG